LPKGVTITALQHEDVEAHDQTVVSISEAKVVTEEEEDFSEAPVAPESDDAESDAASEDGDNEA
jgi:large subunit ribosomal protein L25